MLNFNYTLEHARSHPERKTVSSSNKLFEYHMNSHIYSRRSSHHKRSDSIDFDNSQQLKKNSMGEDSDFSLYRGNSNVTLPDSPISTARPSFASFHSEPIIDLDEVTKDAYRFKRKLSQSSFNNCSNTRAPQMTKASLKEESKFDAPSTFNYSHSVPTTYRNSSTVRNQENCTHTPRSYIRKSGSDILITDGTCNSDDEHIKRSLSQSDTHQKGPDFDLKEFLKEHIWRQHPKESERQEINENSDDKSSNGSKRESISSEVATLPESSEELINKYQPNRCQCIDSYSRKKKLIARTVNKLRSNFRNLGDSKSWRH